jgi:hypothetical protein
MKPKGLNRKFAAYRIFLSRQHPEFKLSGHTISSKWLRLWRMIQLGTCQTLGHERRSQIFVQIIVVCFADALLLSTTLIG